MLNFFGNLLAKENSGKLGELEVAELGTSVTSFIKVYHKPQTCS